MDRRQFAKTTLTALAGATFAKVASAGVPVSEVAKSTAPYKSKFSPNFRSEERRVGKECYS